MEKGIFIILQSREGSSMASTWTEYLCLQRLANQKYELSIRGYEVLGEQSDYYNEEKDDYDIPQKINGKEVVGIEDGFIVGGRLVEQSDDLPSFEFYKTEIESVNEWLKEIQWNEDSTINLIKEKINQIK